MAFRFSPATNCAASCLLPALAALLLASPGCADVSVRTTAFAAPAHGPIATLAVAPFDNLTTTPTASQAVTAAIIHELRQRGTFQIVEIESRAPGISERWTAARAGKELKADAVLVGVVTAFDYERAARRGGTTLTPSIGLDVRLVGVGNADVLWAAGVGGKLRQLFSDDSMPLEQLAQKLAERIADEIEAVRTN